MREREKYCKEEKRQGKHGSKGDVVMIMLRDDEMQLNEKLFVRRGGKVKEKWALSMKIGLSMEKESREGT